MDGFVDDGRLRFERNYVLGEKDKSNQRKEVAENFMVSKKSKESVLESQYYKIDVKVSENRIL